ncbi:TlpA family protein disulfide reductase [bacterium]|nr:MAG: TlpA family protein disulfide reductase [bacterium]
MRRFVALFLCLFFALNLVSCSKEKGAGAPAKAEDQSGTIKERLSGDTVLVEVNAKAPAFAAPLLGGGEGRLSDFIGNHVVLLEFWSIFCKSCIEEMPKILKLHDKYSSRGLTVLSVNTDFFPDARIIQTLSKAGIDLKYPVLRDKDQQISKDYNVELLPVTLVIDKSGYIRLFQEGYKPGDEERFEEAVQKLLETKRDENVTLASKNGLTTFAPSGMVLRKEGAVGKATGIATLDGGEAIIGGGENVLLFFWSFYCQPCREEFPSMEELAKQYPRVKVYAVNVDSPYLEKRIRGFLSANTTLPCIPDWGKGGIAGPLAKAFGVSATPTTVLLDGAGRIIHSGEGAKDMDDLKAHLEKI